MRVLLADDHPLFRDGLSGLLNSLQTEAQPAYASDYKELAQQLTQTDWDLILLDLDMPGATAAFGIAEIRAQAPDAKIVVVSANESHATVRDVLAQGVQGYLPKSASNEVMRHALRLVLSGDRYLPPLLLETQAGQETHPVAGTALTPREREVLTMLAKGKANKEIARALNISGTTVKTHVAAIFRTLNVHNRTQAGLCAAELGLV